MKPNHNINIQELQSNSLRAVLARLDSYMDATGHGVDHAWRVEIAAALAQPIDAGASLEHALAAVNVADLGVAIINQLTTLIESIAAIAQIDAADPIAMGRQVATIRRLARHAHHFAADQAESYSCDRDELDHAFEALKGGSE